MKILFISSLCTKEAYDNIFLDNAHKTSQQIQKHCKLLARGIHNNNVTVQVFSKLPINRRNYKKIFVSRKDEVENGICYHYCKMINVPIITNIIVLIQCFSYTLFYCIKNRDAIVLCDSITASLSLGGLMASKLSRIKYIGMITDLLTIYAHNENNKPTLQQRIIFFLTRYVDSYMFVTQQMNSVVNKKGKPYIVIESFADINIENIINNIDNKYKKKVCLYAGGIFTVYGIKMLVEAFLLADVQDSELHLYGDGTYSDKLKEICKSYSNVKYFGVMPNEYVIQEQIKATLLINPRPTDKEFTKYSFPIKITEYMASGTPMVTTKLSGIPYEYYGHLYFFDDESTEGMARTLKTILSKSTDELHNDGMESKKWIMKEKNNVMQMEKFIEFIKQHNAVYNYSANINL